MLLSRLHRSKYLPRLSQTFGRPLSTHEARNELWEQEKVRQTTIGRATQDTIQIKYQEKLTLEVAQGQFTPVDLIKQLKGVNLEIPKNCIVAKINGRDLWDLNTPLEESCTLELLNFESQEGKHVFWHSAAHILGQAVELEYGDKVQLCDGPSLTEGGFFYEMFLQDEQTISQSNFSTLKDHIKRIVKAKQPYERLLVTQEFARKMFHDNPYKLQMLENIPKNERITLYRCGPFIDLCRGPHVPHTGVFAATELTRCGASHWQGKSDGQLLQRIYGIAFPDKPKMREWKHIQEEAAKRDHRLIGKAQGLFMFHSHSPGSSFMLPHGTRIFNRLCAFLRSEYTKRGYEEVITPLLYKTDLWATSGHLENYKEDMFLVKPGEEEAETESVGCSHHSDEFGLKPMNCPGHCLIFKESRNYSYRDLPVRLADFSALHRNEASGALTGLTRVRRFHQDDGHIFCAPHQVQDEISDCLDFIKHVYDCFGFKFTLKLSTRPDKFMGEVEAWDNAEGQLKQALDNFGEPWELNEGDGAFYGPKIDIAVTDALKRQHQCGTIQLDFQLPQRFELSYNGSDGQDHTPIIVHRAVLGSLERIMAILIEHTAGKWPLWISPRQVAILPVSEAHAAYAKQLAEKLTAEDIYVDVARDSKTLNKRIRESQLLGYNYILVVGEKEVAGELVNVRTRENVVHGTQSFTEFLHNLQTRIQQRSADE